VDLDAERSLGPVVIVPCPLVFNGHRLLTEKRRRCKAR
jgi:hypothetical protein